MRYRVAREFHVESTRFQAGRVVSAEDIPAGNLASALSVGLLVEHEEPAELKAVPPSPEIKTAAKKPRKPRATRKAKSAE